MEPEIRFGNYLLSSLSRRVDIRAVHAYLSKESYWARGIPLETVERSIHNSWCFSVLSLEQQVGFARLITDHSTFAYLADVYILPEHRGKGLSKALIGFLVSFPEVAGYRRLMLATLDAHGLYARFGFQPMVHPERLMSIHRPDIYIHPEQ